MYIYFFVCWNYAYTYMYTAYVYIYIYIYVVGHTVKLVYICIPSRCNLGSGDDLTLLLEVLTTQRLSRYWLPFHEELIRVVMYNFALIGTLIAAGSDARSPVRRHDAERQPQLPPLAAAPHGETFDPSAQAQRDREREREREITSGNDSKYQYAIWIIDIFHMIFKAYIWLPSQKYTDFFFILTYISINISNKYE